ncbi:MAG: hypothetical protein IPH00_16580 [Flavobacteriales bacterium]|nr:hypothetical protein [Flavobacteriales bacterium]
MKIINFITGLLFTFLVASVASNVTGMDMGTAFAGCAVGSVLLSFAPIPKGIASAVVLRQMWEAEPDHRVPQQPHVVEPRTA